MSFKINGNDLGLIPKTEFFDLYPSLTNVIASPALWCWGGNSYVMIGDNTTTNRSSPVQTVAGGTNWKQIASYGVHVAAIKTDGTLWTWGQDNYGQLGDNARTAKSSPAQTVSATTTWKQVACGYHHTLAIKTDGTLWAWGKNNFGQLGDNTSAHKSSPVQTIAAGTTWKQVAAGNAHSAAIKTDGTLWGWGANSGNLGDNTLTNRSSPVQTVAGGTNWKQVACGQAHTIAIKTDGTLWSCGYNLYGQLGDNTITDKSSPVQTIAGGTNWKFVASNASVTAAIKTDGTLWLWGRNTPYPKIGDNTSVHKSSPVQTIAGGTNWKQVAFGYGHTLAIKTDGTLWTWGGNGNGGALGDNTSVDKLSPIQTIAGGTNWKQITGGMFFSAAIAEDDATL